MSILSGYGKFKRYVLTDSGYKLCSHWTSSNTVHFDDGNTAQNKLGAISGITDSLTSTSSNVALSAAGGKNLQEQITELNSNLQASINNLKSVATMTTEAEYDNNLGLHIVQDTSDFVWISRPIVIVNLISTGFLGTISSIFWRDGYIYFEVLFNNAKYTGSVLVDITMIGYTY